MADSWAIPAAMANEAIRVVHTLPSISEEASGPSYSVTALCEALGVSGVNCTLAVSGQLPDRLPSVRTFPRSRFPHKLGRSPRMHQWLGKEAAAGQIDLLHNHSLWMMPNIYPGWISKKFNVPLVISPRGTLSETALNRSHLAKSIVWLLLQKKVLNQSVCFHATADSEYEQIRRVGFMQPVAIIPNGVAIPKSSTSRKDCSKTVLFLGRIHPIKGIENLLAAWRPIESRFPDWQLKIVGPGKHQYVAELKQRASFLGLKRVAFAGPLYGTEKKRAYQTAALYVLPTHSENFGMAVAEALAAGTPVITTKGAPWSGVTKHEAGWWIDIGVEPLTDAVEFALSQPMEKLERMGRSGREWMRQDFSWDRIAAQMLQTYQWILKGGDVPPWVRVG